VKNLDNDVWNVAYNNSVCDFRLHRQQCMSL